LLESQKQTEEKFSSFNQKRSGGVIRALQGKEKYNQNALNTDRMQIDEPKRQSEQLYLRKMYKLDTKISKLGQSINKIGFNIIKRMRDEN
jgi:hypothetical protein